MKIKTILGAAKVAWLAVAAVGCGSASDTTGPDVILPEARPRIEGSWRAGPTLPSAQDAASYVVFGRELFLVGGARVWYGSDEGTVTDVFRLSLDAPDQWAPGPSYPVDGIDIGFVALGDTLLGIGGMAFPSKRWERLFVLSADDDDWTRLEPDVLPRGPVSAVLASGMIVAIDVGGDGTVWLRDETDGAWTTGQPFPRNESHFEVVTDGTLVYAVYGRSMVTPFGPTGAIYAYDPRSDSWTSVTIGPLPRTDPGIAFWAGRIHIFGGIDAAFEIRADHIVYDITSDTWYDAPELPQALAGVESVAADGEVWALGGWHRDLSPALRTEVTIFTPGG